jgi:serine/threonine protein kinase
LRKKGIFIIFVMEYVDGEPLNKKISAGLPLREGLILLQKTLGALHYAHQQELSIGI